MASSAIIRNSFMFTCHDISEQAWAEVFQALVLFFRHRLVADPEELAQESLVRIVGRKEPFLFEKEEDFPKVCYGFGKLVLLEHQRKQQHHPAGTLDPDLPAPSHQADGMQSTEDRIFLEQVFRIGQNQLKEKETMP